MCCIEIDTVSAKEVRTAWKLPPAAHSHNF